ncbi:hypothetical protein ADL29_33875 [Streptomyces chattanoogensis]|uniref:Uncharacterized protein n=1 Tax=Streptomyces chattanoogensis TaxID=66876 RepID=A0A0N0GVV6_9ACTN|nr:hypothetical protein ADL29_33875 [Streptomyces chattanoogensis]
MYGEDPYGGAGYTYAYGHESAYGQEYAYGHEYGGGVAGVTTDTASPAWNGVAPAQWAHPTGQATTAGDCPHGDVLTAQLPVFDTEQFPAVGTQQHPVSDTAQLPVFDAPGHPVPEPDTPQSESARPVFVDSSGRRQRRVLRAARLLVIPAGGYVAVLISTMLGGPDISSPFVPHADSAHSARPRATAPDPSSGTGRSPRSASPTAAQKNSGTAAQPTPGPTGRPTASADPAAPSGPPTTAAPAHSSKGRGLGSSHKRVK